MAGRCPRRAGRHECRGRSHSSAARPASHPGLSAARARPPHPQVNELDSAVNRAAEQPQRFGLTPEELSKEVGLEREDVIRFCVEEGVPIYHGKIDKTLFQAQL